MITRTAIKTTIKEQGLLPLYYHEDPKTCIEVMKALSSAGIKCIEFTNRGTRAYENFKLLVKERDRHFPDLLLATGTIKSAQEATLFLEAGADFIISPVFETDVCTIAAQKNKLWIPGCMTPTEIHLAQAAGCSIIKLFPGNVLGTEYITAIRPLFSGLEYIVTGGVEPEETNLRGWFGSGVSAVGMGSRLFTNELLEKGNFQGLTDKTTALLTMIKSVRV